MPNSYTSSFRGYLGRLLLVTAGVLGLALAATVAMVKYAVEPNDRVIQSLNLVRRATGSDAAFGDSHFAWGFVGSPEFPTFAAEGETVSDMELRVRYYFRDKKPGKVIIQGDPHTFAPYKLDRATHAYLQNLDDRFWQRFVDHHRPYLGLYWERVLASGSFDVFRPKDELRWGWIVGHEQWARVDSVERLGQASARVQRLTPVADFESNQFAASYRHTLEFLRSRGADVCVITTPVSYEYYKYSSTDSSTAAALAFVRRVAKENGARYVDFYDLYAHPEFASYFRDMDHLNEIGAPRFTSKVLSACFDPTMGTLGSTRHEGP
ncbi:MAG: D-alanyl-lipoteichoic acid biosynthesis protein DltD [Gemmatimonadales bacterium]